MNINHIPWKTRKIHDIAVTHNYARRLKTSSITYYT